MLDSLTQRDQKVMGIATGLVLLNILLVYALAVTPLSGVALSLYATPLVGFIAYAVALTGGQALADIGVKDKNPLLAGLGVLILQLAYGTLGAALLTFLPRSWHLTALGVTAVLTTLFTLGVSLYVFWTDQDLDHWQSYANYAFGLAFLLVIGGTFIFPLLLVPAFLCTFAGFTFMLGHNIWDAVANAEAHSPWFFGIRIYVAVMGVFIHILRIVIRILIALSENL